MQGDLDDSSYVRFTGPQVLHKALNTLDGLIKGILFDGRMEPEEARELMNWVHSHGALSRRHPFNELVPRIEAALIDGRIDEAEARDITWLCSQYSLEKPYFDSITSSIQELQGMLHGLLSDGTVSTKETEALRYWVDGHRELTGIYPFDEIESLLTAVLSDGIIDESERRQLKDFFEAFVDFSLARRMKDARKSHGQGRNHLSPACAQYALCWSSRRSSSVSQAFPNAQSEAKLPRASWSLAAITPTACAPTRTI